MSIGVPSYASNGNFLEAINVNRIVASIIVLLVLPPLCELQYLVFIYAFFFLYFANSYQGGPEQP